MMSERGNRKRGLGRQRRRVFLLLLGCVLLQHVAGAATAEHGGDEDDNGGDAATRVAGALAQDSAKDAVERENEEDEEQDLLAGYVNDFNMQHEASIPEDILDQRHIDEVDQAGDEDQEFILESQRSTSGSFTSYDNSNNIDNNNGRNRNDRSNNNKNYAGAEARDGVADDEVHRPKKKKASNRNHYKNFKKTAGKNNNNNDRNDRAKKISNVGDNNDDDDDDDDDAAMRRNSNGNRGNFEDGDNENTQSVSLMSSGSIKDDKLKNKQRQAAEAAGRQRQQLDAVADLNERKFNKLPAAAAASEDNEDDNDDVDVLWRDNSSSSRNRNNNSDSDKNIAIDKENFDDDDDINEDDEGGDEELKQQQQQHFIDDAVGRTAVGDIEESFANEGAVGPSQESGAADSGGGAAVVGAGELGGAASATSTSATTMGPTTTTTASTTPTMTTTAFPQFVGRKSKRHGARPQSRFFSVAAVPNGEGKLQKMTAPSDRSSRNHRYPGISISSSSSGPNYQQRHQEEPDPANGSLSPKKLRGGDDHDDDEDVDEASHDRADEPLIQDKAEDVTPGNRFDSAALETTTPSAFEHHKAQRRNGRRSGHKSHKKRYKDYLRYVIATEATTTTAAASPTDTTVADGGDRRHQQRLAKWQSYKSDLRALAKARRLPAASAPIFVVASRAADDADDGGGNATGRPYYEGQLSYYLETRDGDGDGDGDEGMARGLADEDVGKLVTSERDGNWYRRGSPILRNGMANVQDKYRQHGHHSHGHNHNHHLQHQHQHQHQPHQHQHHHQHHHQYQQQQHLHRQPGKHQQHHAYQRRLPASRKTPSTEQQPLARSRQQPAAATAATSPPELQLGYRAGHKGAMQELGHQITQMEEFDRYYRKWPHLARVQYQLNDENYREAHPEAYEYVDQRGTDEAYDELDVDVDADGEGDEDANLPPYIKKYNRRNKQLLNLLEGTLPPPTPPTRPPPARVWSSSVLQPGPRDAAYYWKTRGRVPGGDDEAEGGRRRGDSEDWRAKDSFAEQRLSTVAPTSTAVAQSSASPAQLPNSIPGEDVDLSSQEFDDWEKEIEARMTGSEKMRWQIEKATPRPSHSRGGSVPTTMTTTTTTTTLKPAVFRLPSYPTFAGGFVGKPRSRSAQFAPSAGGVGRGNGFISSTLHGAGSPGGYKSRPPYGLAAQAESAEDTHEPYNANYSATNTNGNSDNIYSSGNNRKYGSDAGGSSASASGSGSGSGSKAINNAFVYHRVEAAPRLVGAGPTGHKQRLPFVAITDRRLETAKKALTERQRDFEQNHYPMP